MSENKDIQKVENDKDKIEYEKIPLGDFSYQTI